MDEEIRYTLSLVDNISESLTRIESAQQRLQQSIEASNQSADSQKITFIASVTAIRSVDMGFRGLTNVLISTGVVGASTTKVLKTMQQAVHGVSSAFQLMKGARQIIIGLQAAEVSLASVETYRSILLSPGKMALVGVALGAAAAAVGYFVGRDSARSSGDNINTSITFSPEGSASERDMARGTLSILGG